MTKWVNEKKCQWNFHSINSWLNYCEEAMKKISYFRVRASQLWWNWTRELKWKQERKISNFLLLRDLISSYSSGLERGEKFCIDFFRKILREWRWLKVGVKNILKLFVLSMENLRRDIQDKNLHRKGLKKVSHKKFSLP
jgi:hypothetical protein